MPAALVPRLGAMRASAILALVLVGLVFAAPASASSVVVRPGDTLSAIAARTGVSVRSLVRANGIEDPDRIRAGVRLRVPSARGSAAAEPRPTGAAGSTHRVRRGDTLGAIARRYGTSIEAIVRANGLRDRNSIVVGASLRIPSRGAAAGPGSSVARLLDEASARHGVSASLARAVAWQESRFRQSAVSSAGAVGVMQLMPATARWIGAALLGRPVERRRVADNIEAGVAYIAYLRRRTGSTERALAAYYQGPGSVSRNGPSPKTLAYVASVMSAVGRV